MFFTIYYQKVIVHMHALYVFVGVFDQLTQAWGCSTQHFVKEKGNSLFVPPIT